MKKILLFAAALMATAKASAQVVLWNGEDKGVGSDGGFWNRSTPTVVEEDGNKCLQITLADATNDWERHNVGLGLGDTNLKGLRRISIRIKMPDAHNVLVKLGKDGVYTLSRLFYYGKANTWQTLVFDYSVGPDNDKVVDTNNTVLEIWPYENYNAENNGKKVYIDDILLEGPMVGGVAVRTLADGSLTDKQVIVTGSLKKGNYQNTWDGDWHSEAYDDYSLLLSKLSPSVCFLNLTDAAVADGDSPQLRQKNPNLLVLSPVDFAETDNVIRWDGSKNVTPKMVLNEVYPFHTPIDFTATSVELTHQLFAGTNTFCLPFAVSKSELGGKDLATFKSAGTSIVFTKTDEVAANTPFVLLDATASTTALTFSNKEVKSADNLGTTFVGVYVPQSATGMYGIATDNKIMKGGAQAKINAFHAYLASVASAREIMFDDETTQITTTNYTDYTNLVYSDLQGRRVAQPTRGLYIVNGRKVIVK